VFLLVATPAAAALASAAACSPFSAEEPPISADAATGADAATNPDAAVDPVGHGSITCVTEASLPPPSCAAGQACCLTWGPGVVLDKCVAPDAPPCGGTNPSTKLLCDEESDCAPGGVCCRFDLESPNRFEAYCVGPAACNAPLHRMCANDAECLRRERCKPIVTSGGTLYLKSCQ